MQRTDPEYCRALRFLFDRINYEKTVDRPYHSGEFKLTRMAFLLELLGNPQLAAPVIHVAGTKGKGSVCWLLAEAFRLSSLRTGLFTSPHLVDLEERFVVQGEPVAPGVLCEGIERLRHVESLCAASEHGRPTFFELTTALGWFLFAQAKTDVNVIEVGLGGRLDSTNVCAPELCIITSISYDHQQQLGETLSLIAGEKAGIIKEGCPVISGARALEAAEVIRAVAKSKNAELLELGTDFECEWSLQAKLQASGSNAEHNGCNSSVIFSHKLPRGVSKGPVAFDLRMLGSHQGDNAALAVAAWHKLQAMGWDLSDDALRASLAGTQVPARLEIVSESPLWILDAGHNEASITAMLSALDAYFPDFIKTIVFACSKDKKVQEMLRLIVPKVDRLVLTQFQSNPRFTPVEKLEQLTNEILGTVAVANAEGVATKCSVVKPAPMILSASDLPQAIEFLRHHPFESRGRQEVIVITGSFFIAAEAKAIMSSV
jgi:dihydrofolate synthase / folylpolyglutamate synthase